VVMFFIAGLARLKRGVREGEERGYAPLRG